MRTRPSSSSSSSSCSGDEMRRSLPPPPPARAVRLAFASAVVLSPGANQSVASAMVAMRKTTSPIPSSRAMPGVSRRRRPAAFCKPRSASSPLSPMSRRSSASLGGSSSSEDEDGEGGERRSSSEFFFADGDSASDPAEPRTAASFGDSVPYLPRSDSDRAASPSITGAFGESVPYVPSFERAGEPSEASSTGGFGESVPFTPPAKLASSPAAGAVQALSPELELLKANRRRNAIVAVVSFTYAIGNYINQILHPVTAVEVLARMQSQSAPLALIGNNGRPTVVDFWAPWCENCKSAAPTLRAVEEEYADRVNFVLVNGDESANWPLIEKFGVDSIPHLAMLSGEGDVETALIGPIPRAVLRANLDALLAKREGCDASSSGVAAAVEDAAPVVRTVCHDELPYKMYDAFGNRPTQRRINFVEQ